MHDIGKHLEVVTRMLETYRSQNGLSAQHFFMFAAVTASNTAKLGQGAGAIEFDGSGWDFVAAFANAMSRRDEDTVNKLLDWRIPSTSNSGPVTSSPDH